MILLNVYLLIAIFTGYLVVRGKLKDFKFLLEEYREVCRRLKSLESITDSLSYRVHHNNNELYHGGVLLSSETIDDLKRGATVPVFTVANGKTDMLHITAKDRPLLDKIQE